MNEANTTTTRALLADFAWDFLFPPSSLSPDLAPSDFHLFTHLMYFLGSTRMRSDERVKTVKVQWTGSRFLRCRHTETRHMIQMLESS
jgi:hypothetical protein